MDEAAQPLMQNGPAGTQSAARHYVNHIDLSFTLSEVRIDLGQLFGGSEPLRRQCRLITSPVHLRRMGEEISATISHYETRFGTIPGSDQLDGEDHDG